jgi:hypothetical protein
MASSEAPEERRAPRKASRRLTWLAVFILLLFGGYTAGWFWVGGLLRERAVEFINSANQSGLKVECANARAGGFPFRIGLFCDRVRYEDPKEGIALSAEALRSAAQIYNPFLLIAELDSQASVGTPAGALNLNWENLRASLRYNLEAPERLSIEASDLKAAFTPPAAAAIPLFVVKDAQMHVRPNLDDIDLASQATNLVIDPAMLPGGSLPPFSGESDISIKDGVTALRGGGDLVLGRSGTIRHASLSTADASLSISGPFFVGEDGLVDADLWVKAKNPGGIAPIAVAAFPESAEQIAESLSGLALLGENATLPLKIEDGEMTLGFLPIGRIPPLLAR